MLNRRLRKTIRTHIECQHHRLSNVHIIMIGRFSRIIASLFGLGYIKRGPATTGAIVGALLFYLIQPIQVWFTIVMLLTVFVVGVYVSFVIASNEKINDPPYIIIDELVGCWVALLFIPKTLVLYTAAILLFRVFDKTKIFGIKKIEKFSGGWGIMLDDILAGVYTNILIQIFIIGYKYYA